MRKAKERIIYNSYDLWENYEADARESLKDNCGIENPTYDQIWEEIYFLDSINWESDKAELEHFFNDGSTWILQGTTGRWDGSHRGGYIFTDFEDMFYKATKDCGYIKFYDENGHFYLQCSHHDGTNDYEIKRITDAGIQYYERWNYSWSDQRTKEQVHDMIMKRYSTLPHYAHKVYGVKKVEYEAKIA